MKVKDIIATLNTFKPYQNVKIIVQNDKKRVGNEIFAISENNSECCIFIKRETK